MFVPIRDAVIIARTTPDVIRRWARDGLLPTETGDDGEPHYEIQALVRLEAQNRQAARRHAYANLATRLTPGA
jgi:hypothetical protein